MGKKVVVRMNPRTGVTTVEVNGVKGQSCYDLTRKLEESLGTIQSCEDNPDAFETETVTGFEEQTQD